jgi:hypothetical protein
VERELAAKLENMISMLRLAESARASLDSALRHAGDVAGRVQVLRRWFAGIQGAHAMTKTVVAGRDEAAELRALRPREERRHSIAPWINKR